jgi:cysteine and glycine-rich protein
MFGASIKCGACNKTIYPNDNKLSMGDKVYHKQCSKCETCRGQLTISNFATSGSRLLCKTHFMKEFSESGGVYGGDEKFSKNQSRSSSTVSSTSSTSSSQSNTPVITATKKPPAPPAQAAKKPPAPPAQAAKKEQVTVSTEETVTTANRKSVAEMIAATKATTVSTKDKSPTTEAKKPRASRFSKIGGGSSKKCPKCSKTIYLNDPQVAIVDSTYHKSCAKCETCKGQLTISNFATSGDRLLCKTHFMEEFANSGGHYGGDEKFGKSSSSRSNSAASNASTVSIKSTPETSNTKTAEVKIPPVVDEKATTSVKVEKIEVVEKKPEAVATIVEQVDSTAKEVQDTAKVDAAPKRMSVAERIKHDKQKAIKARKSRFGSGSSIKCGACSKTIYPNDNKLSMGDKVYHKQCSKCETCRGQLTISNFATSGSRLLCKTHFMKEFSESGGVYGGDEKFSKNQSRSNSSATQ